MNHDHSLPSFGFHPALFYALAFAIAWIAWTPLLLHVRGLFEIPIPFPVSLFVCQTLGAFAPLISLLLIQRIKNTPGLVKQVLGRIRLKGVPLRWFFWPAALPVVIAISTALVHALVSTSEGLTILKQEPLDEIGWALLLVIPFTFIVAMIGSPFGEEPGWRGYVLDQFARRNQACRGSALVAVLWWVWHVPLFLVLGVEPNAGSFLEMVGHSLLIDSFFLLSNRNLLSAMLYHQGVNIAFMFFAPKTQSTLGLVVLLGTALTLRTIAKRRLTDALSARGKAQ
jgi:membrane protease YdiL (CAAX protease family)